MKDSTKKPEQLFQDQEISQIEERIKEKAKTAFDQQADSLDSQTLQRLRMAREKALSQQKTKPKWLSIKWLTGAGAGLALASVMTFMIVPQLSIQTFSTQKLSPLEDLEMLSSETELDLYTQLDFYQWLDESLDES